MQPNHPSFHHSDTSFLNQEDSFFQHQDSGGISRSILPEQLPPITQKQSLAGMPQRVRDNQAGLLSMSGGRGISRTNTSNNLFGAPKVIGDFAAMTESPLFQTRIRGHRSVFQPSESDATPSVGVSPANPTRKMSMPAFLGLPISKPIDMRINDQRTHEDAAKVNFEKSQPPYGLQQEQTPSIDMTPSSSFQNYTFSRAAAANMQRQARNSALVPQPLNHFGTGSDVRSYSLNPSGQGPRLLQVGGQINQKQLLRNLRRLQQEKENQQAKISDDSHQSQGANQKETVIRRLTSFLREKLRLRSQQDKESEPGVREASSCRQITGKISLEEPVPCDGEAWGELKAPPKIEINSLDEEDDIGTSSLSEWEHPPEEMEVKSKLSLTIRPSSLFNQVYLVVVKMVSAFELVYVPLEIAFVELLRGPLQAVPIAVFSLNFLSKCFTRVVDPNSGQEVTSPKQIIKRYSATFSFYVDILGALPIALLAEIFMPPNSACLFNLLRLVKAGLEWRGGGLEKQTEQVKLRLRLVKLIVFLVVYVHFTSCFLYFIADLDRQWQPNMSRFAATDPGAFYAESVTTRYLASLYTSVMVLSGNEINPVSNLQIALASVLTVIGALMLANVFGTLAVVFTAMNRKHQQLQDSIDLANASMTNMKLPGFLQDSIRQFMLVTQTNLDSQTELDQFMSMISPSLRTQVTKYIFMGAVSSNPVFKGASDKLDFLINDVSTLLFQPEDTIVTQGQQGESLFLIAKGDCAVSVSDHLWRHSAVRQLGQGEYFGEVSLLMGVPRTATVKSSNYCTLARLEKKVFFSLCSSFPDIMLQMKRRALQYDDPWKKFKSSLVGQVDYFARSSEEFFDEIQFQLEEENFEEGAVITKARERCEGISFLIDGRVSLTVENDKGEPVEIGELKQGDIIGQYSVLVGRPLNFQAKALTRVRCLVLSQEFLGDSKDLVDGLNEAYDVADKIMDKQGVPFLDFTHTKKQKGPYSDRQHRLARQGALRRVMTRIKQLKKANKLYFFKSALENQITDMQESYTSKIRFGDRSSPTRRNPLMNKFSLQPEDFLQPREVPMAKQKRSASVFRRARRHGVRGCAEPNGMQSLQDQLKKLQEIIQKTQLQPEVTSVSAGHSSSSGSIRSSPRSVSSASNSSEENKMELPRNKLPTMLSTHSSKEISSSSSEELKQEDDEQPKALMEYPSLLPALPPKRQSMQVIQNRKSLFSGSNKEEEKSESLSQLAQSFHLKLATQLEISESSSEQSESERKQIFGRHLGGDLSRKIYVLSERSKEESEETASLNLFHKQRSRISSGEQDCNSYDEIGQYKTGGEGRSPDDHSSGLPNLSVHRISLGSKPFPGGHAFPPGTGFVRRHSQFKKPKKGS